jgi:hypothetical protein
LGYSTYSNGAARAVIAALKYYGLLEPAGNGLRVSADAVRALELPKEDPERGEALARMAFAPPIFADLRKKYGGQLPLSVRHSLVTQEFAPHAADEIIRLYRANFDCINGKGADNDAEETSTSKDQTSGVSSGPKAAESIRGRAYPETSFDRVLQFQIAEDTDARIHFRGRPNRPAIKKLVALLELSADTFPA